MKKLLAIFICVLMAFTALCACDNSSGGGAGEEGCGHEVTTRATYTEKDGDVYKEYYCNECADTVKHKIKVAGIVSEENQLTAIQQGKDFEKIQLF